MSFAAQHGFTLDDDGLVLGSHFVDADQEHVRIGNQWFKLDRRIPWQLGACIRTYQDEDLGTIRLRLAEVSPVSDDDYQSPMRKAHWWGPRLDWARVDDGTLRDHTVHGDPETCLASIAKPQLARFWWTYPKEQPLAVLQVEEFADLPERFPLSSRYAHSMRDRKKQSFEHLDFAVKSYSSADALEDAYERGSVKAPGYEKLFRIDGTISTERWSEYFAAFFARSPLVAEYFGAG